MGMKLKKAVIPAAGYGTRFLPATKSIPKEMLPLVDAPSLLYIVEEAVAAGIEDIIFIAGRGKTAIEDFFDISYEVEDVLAQQGKSAFLERLVKVRNKMNLISIRQKQALGLGHAVLTARPVVGNEPFAVLLGDEIMLPKNNLPNTTEQLSRGLLETGISTVAIMQVPEKEVSKYGIVKLAGPKPPAKIDFVVEKPSVESAPSNWALPGRYAFTSAIFKYLENARPGKNGEIQLTDGMNELAKNEGLIGSSFEARRYDAGDKFGYLQANIEIALDHPEVGTQLKVYLQNLVREWK
jgi:UTP--glucose-1-phosphate uridylyltransferase